MNVAWAVASGGGAATGAITTLALTVRGLAQSGRRDAAPRHLKLLSAVAGCAAGAVAVEASRRAGTSWAVPALYLWACALAAAAACDAVAQRIPTAFVRQAGLGTAGLLAVGLGADDDWRGLILSVVAAAALGLVMLLCWRFAGAGFGDVRLAVFGGLGLGHATHRGVEVGLVVFCVATLTQVVVVVARGGSRHTNIPLGPALATGLLAAASF